MVPAVEVPETAGFRCFYVQEVQRLGIQRARIYGADEISSMRRVYLDGDLSMRRAALVLCKIGRIQFVAEIYNLG